MMTMTVIVSLIVALLCRGSFAALARAEFRGIWLAILAIIIRLYLYAQGAAEAEWVARWVPYLLTVSYGLLLYVVWLNRERLGVILFGLGSLANYVVIAVNGWRMPISRTGLVATGQADLIDYLAGPADYVHGLLDDGTKLRLLADVLYLPPPFPRPTVFSLGDVLIMMGVFLLIFTMMSAKLPRLSHQ